jgi:hypothetical protein
MPSLRPAITIGTDPESATRRKTIRTINLTGSLRPWLTEGRLCGSRPPPAQRTTWGDGARGAAVLLGSILDILDIDSRTGID